MKWFKHISDSLDDPFIFDLIEKHDANGYLVFFGILEIYAREFKTEPGWKLQVTLPYLRRKLNRTRNKLITNVLRTLGELSENFERTSEELCTNVNKISAKTPKWDVEIKGDEVCIFIPKFKELMDESTLKKLRENEKSFRKESGLIPKSEPTDVEADKEEDKDKDIGGVPKKKKTPPNPDVKIFLDYAFETFQQTFGEKMLVNGTKDGGIIKGLLGTYDLEKLKSLWDAFVKSDDPFIVKAGRSIGVFTTQVNKLISGDGGKQSNQPLFGLSPESEAQIKQRDEYEAKLRRQRESEDE